MVLGLYTSRYEMYRFFALVKVTTSADSGGDDMHRFVASNWSALPLSLAIGVAISSSAAAQTSGLQQNNAQSSSRNTGSAASGQAGGASGTQESLSRLESLNQEAGQGGGGDTSAFVGRGDNAGSLVGRQNAGSGQQGRATQNRNFGSSGGNRSGNQFRNQFNQFNQFNRGSSSSQLGTFRPRLRVAFAVPKRPTSVVTSSLKMRYQKLSTRFSRFSGIDLQLDGNGQVTLSGQVASESSKRLAANLARLQPGVRSVKNGLTIATSTSP